METLLTKLMCGLMMFWMVLTLVASMGYMVVTPACRTGGENARWDCLGGMDWWFGWLWWVFAGWGA